MIRFCYAFDSPSKEIQGYYEILAMMLQLIDFETVGTLAHRNGCPWDGKLISRMSFAHCSIDGLHRITRSSGVLSCWVEKTTYIVLAKCYSKRVPKHG